MATSTSGTSAASQQTLDALLAKLGVKSTTDASASTTHKTQLDQGDFLKLMTAQLSNQDPFNPQTNDQMIAQMAQFSTVSGISQLNTTMNGVATELSQNRIATAATFVGKTVLVPGNTAMTDSSGAISGAIDLPSDVSSLTVNISTPAGQLVKTLNLGANSAGLVGFSWDGKDSKGQSVGEDTYTVQALMIAGGKSASATVDVYAPVTEASFPTGSTSTNDMTLKVGGLTGSVKVSDIKALKY
jgi:flagellar basal-body rod modification protein FlgD